MYTPRLRDDLVKRLYALCQRLEIPMTVFMNGAMDWAISRAEECLEAEGKEKALEQIGVEPARTEAAPAPALAAG